jgi:uncharacterized membrane protein
VTSINASAERLPPEAAARDSARIRTVLICAALVALLLKLVLASSTVGTNDAVTWERDLVKLKHLGFVSLYQNGVQVNSSDGRIHTVQMFIHPPAMIHALKILGKLQDLTTLPLRFWMRFLCSLADMGVMIILWKTRAQDFRVLTLVALCPISILISGFHCNTDPLMMFFVVLSVYFAGKERSWASGISLGLAAAIKIVPILFAPVILLHLPPRRRHQFVGVAALTWIAAGMPFVAEAPVLIFKTVFGYQGATGLWGLYMLSAIASNLGAPGVHAIYSYSAKWLAAASALLLPVVLRKRGVPLLAQCGAVAALFLFLSPGFGLQYLAWVVPWLGALRFRAAAVFAGIALVLMASSYLDAMSYVTLYADFLDPKHWRMSFFLGPFCWLSCGWLAAQFSSVREPAGPTLLQERQPDTVNG